jgi:hypothetical protein
MRHSEPEHRRDQLKQKIPHHDVLQATMAHVQKTLGDQIPAPRFLAAVALLVPEDQVLLPELTAGTVTLLYL